MRLGRRRFLAASASTLLVACGSGRKGFEALEPEEIRIGTLAAREWASRAEIMTYEIPDVSAPHYAEACMALGVMRLGVAGDREDLRDLVRQRWQQASTLENTQNHLDANLIGIWPIIVGDEEGVGQGIALADAQWEETDRAGLTTQARFWIDDIYMIGILQATGWRRTGDQRYLANAALMAEQYLERLQQDNGLFHHGPDAPFFWGRGNGWVAAGLAEILSDMPEDHPRRAPILSGFQSMAEALLATQRSDGLWGQLIDDPQSWSESSCSAMFAFALHRGLNAGLLPDSTYAAVIERAWDGLKDKLDDKGLLQDVCVGTGQSQDAAYYLERPRVTGDLHGQAPLLWLCAERLLSEGV